MSESKDQCSYVFNGITSAQKISDILWVGQNAKHMGVERANI